MSTPQTPHPQRSGDSGYAAELLDRQRYRVHLHGTQWFRPTGRDGHTVFVMEADEAQLWHASEGLITAATFDAETGEYSSDAAAVLPTWRDALVDAILFYVFDDDVSDTMIAVVNDEWHGMQAPTGATEESEPSA